MENTKKKCFFPFPSEKYFQVGNHATLKAVDDVSFEILQG